MSSLMFAAPVKDLREALGTGSLGNLRPLPWAFMTGNCFGWCAYGYYTRDPFVLAANVPGLILSLWLNIGAIKLQYYETVVLVKEKSFAVQQHEEKWDAGDATEDPFTEGNFARRNSLSSLHNVNGSEDGDMDDMSLLVASPHERAFFRMLFAWAVVLVWVGWILPPSHPAEIVGLIVNVNLVFFYGAPLQAIAQVVSSQSSDVIHRPTMYMNYANTSFWVAYGCARKDPIIAVPNALGLLLGLLQGILCLVYPRREIHGDMLPVPLDEDVPGIVGDDTNSNDEPETERGAQ